MKPLFALALLVTSCARIPPPPARAPVSIAKNAALLVEPDLKSACRRWDKGFTDRETVLACGKWMFFYETFGTSGVPASLPRALMDVFTHDVGLGFSKLGLIEDPSSKHHLPFGMAPGGLTGVTASVAYTCASCHVAQLPDGRIVVGAPNHAYDYGRQLLMLTVFPFLATGNPAKHAPEAVALLQPLLDELKRDPRRYAGLGAALMLAMGALKIPMLSIEIERMYASWPKGTQDFLLKPLATDDHVEIVGKIPALFSLPREREIFDAHMVHGMYGWSGNASSLFTFLRGFISLGGGHGDAWTERKLHPLIEYLYSLEAPKNPHRADDATIAAGKALFHDKRCDGCHDGPRHSGKRIYRFDEIGTDPAVARWLDPEKTGMPCCGAKLSDPLTGGIKAPRLDALWMQHRFLHNGSLSSLQQLFCLEPRPERPSPLSSAGHRQTCDGLDAVEKRTLIAYLESL